MTMRIKLRRDTSTAWTTNNPILSQGEPGLETDTGRIKYGDGTTAWNSLNYVAPDLERKRTGWVATWGQRYQESNNDYWWDSVTADDDAAYFIGGSDVGNYATVAKVSNDGTVEWRRTLNNPDGYEGDGTDVKIDPTDNNLVMLSSVYNNANGIDNQGYTINKVNVNTGALIAGSNYRVKDDVDSGSGTGDIYARELAVDADGAFYVFGSKYGDNYTGNVTAETGSTTNTIFISYDGTFPYPREYDNSYIKTQNDASTYLITAVNRYNNLTPNCNPTLGSGATFNVEISDGGTTITATPTNYGSNYAVGRKIYIYGSDLGGLNGDNDIWFYVTSVNGTALSAISQVYFSNVGVVGTYNSVSSTVVPPSDLEINLNFKVTGPSTEYKNYNINTAGQGFAAGDTLTISGASIGGSEPTNNWTANVLTINASGGVTSISAPNWTVNRDLIKLGCDAGGNDFSTGAYKLFINTNEQAYVAKHNSDSDWTKFVGTVDNEYFDGGVVDADGNLYAVGSHYNTNYPGGNRWESLVVKLNSSGAVQWAKSFDIDGFEGYTRINNAVVDSTGNIILSQAGAPATITKITSAGSVLWQKFIGNNEPITTYNASVDVDSDDNIYFIAEMASIANWSDDFLLIKFDSDGDVVWQRSIGSIYDENTNWNNSYSYLAVKGEKIYIAGSTEAYVDPYYNQRDIGLSIQLTTDGDWVDYDYDIWSKRVANWSVTSTTPLVTNVTDLITSNASVTVYQPVFGIVNEASNIDLDRWHVGADIAISNATTIQFEGGNTITRNAGRDIPPVVYSGHQGGNYYLGPRESGRHIYLESLNGNANIYIPGDDVVDLPIGTIFTIVIGDRNGQGVYVFNYTNDSVSVYASGFTGSGNWTLGDSGDRGVYTIMKIENNTWIVSGPDIIQN